MKKVIVIALIIVSVILLISCGQNTGTQLSRLDEIIKVLNENTDLRFSMHAFASDMDKVSETVNRNRLKGIGDYLQVKGIAEDRIESKGITIDPEKSNTIRIILY